MKTISKIKDFIGMLALTTFLSVAVWKFPVLIAALFSHGSSAAFNMGILGIILEICLVVAAIGCLGVTGDKFKRIFDKNE